jgi:type II secretory ATPase GspE/PulE/Tfp pilus assembly ATPase PilB-like protein
MNNIHASLLQISSTPRRFESAVKVFEHIIKIAIEKSASDIHIDHKSSFINIRMRIDGVLELIEKIDIIHAEELVSHIKILSGNRTDIHLLPQDGRCTVNISGSHYHMRTSFMPTFFGESIVLRILPANTQKEISFAKLGFSIEHVRDISSSLNCSHGIILVTGPTGSGKTTTLHACLSEKSKEPISVITLEDPIEYEISGARQIRVEQSQGIMFSTVLRSVLRQDPDVVMVGEIRDKETAELAFHTALTGHLVLSTLHTNSSIETLTRLKDMNIDSYIIASTLRLIISQRLVRMLCVDCCGNGCNECAYTGYKSRTVIAETLAIDDVIRNYIRDSANLSELKSYIYRNGWRDITEHAREKVDWGITGRDEITRVIGSNHV